MTDKVQKIKEEIERLDEEYRTLRVEGTTQQAKEADLVVHVLQKLENFIDSLSEEPASEDLEEEIKNYIQKEYPDGMGFPNVPKIARHFAEWQKHQMKETLQTEYEKGRFDMREEMMKVLVNGEVMKNLNNQLCVKSEPIKDTFGEYKFGDKVKIIILKTE